MCHGARPRPRVARRHRDEDACRGGVERGNLDDVEEGVVVPLIEKLITSTPSATAWSIAAALSAVKQPPVFGFPSSQHTLYVETRARGAMPLIVPERGCGTCRSDIVVPCGVVDVCVPWPSESRGDRKSFGASGSALNWSKACDVELRSDELLVAEVRVPRAVGRPSLTDAQCPLKDGRFLYRQHAVDAVADARVLRPDARVEHPDDDSFAGAAGVGGVRAELRPAELSPELARPVDVEEVGRVGRRPAPTPSRARRRRRWTYPRASWPELRRASAAKPL